MSRRCWLILLLMLISGCAAAPGSRLGDGMLADGRPAEAMGRRLVIWLLSDIQPATIAQRGQFERAIADVNSLAEQVDVGVIAGDLLKSRSRDEDFAWFLASRERAMVPVWFEIAGNHDARNGERFRRYFPRPSRYAVEIGNVLLLLLGDEAPSSQTDISDESFQWWRDMVERHQDRLIITVTHGQLAGSGLLGSFLASRTIAGSGRFEEVLRQRRVAIWASGHSHLPQGLPGTVSRRQELGGTHFVNVSSIDEGLLLDSQSRFFIFEDGSARMVIRSRNHSRGRFDPDLDVVLELDRPFAWRGEEPRVVF